MGRLLPEDIKVKVYPIPGIHQKSGQHVGVPNSVCITHTSGVAAYGDIGRPRRRSTARRSGAISSQSESGRSARSRCSPTPGADLVEKAK
jgi:hypothetical protein